MSFMAVDRNADGELVRHGGQDLIRFERRLSHSIERVWAALTEPAQLRAWWGAAEELELVEGGRFTLRWLNEDEHGKAITMHAEITALDPPRLLETTGDVHGVLRWELRPDGDGTLLIFTSTADFSPEERSSALAGWHWHLDMLPDALDGRPFDWPNWRAALNGWQKLHQQYIAKLR